MTCKTLCEVMYSIKKIPIFERHYLIVFIGSFDKHSVSPQRLQTSLQLQAQPTYAKRLGVPLQLCLCNSKFDAVISDFYSVEKIFSLQRISLFFSRE